MAKNNRAGLIRVTKEEPENKQFEHLTKIEPPLHVFKENIFDVVLIKSKQRAWNAGQEGVIFQVFDTNKNYYVIADKFAVEVANDIDIKAGHLIIHKNECVII